jgi:hypothetical protein
MEGLACIQAMLHPRVVAHGQGARELVKELGGLLARDAASKVGPHSRLQAAKRDGHIRGPPHLQVGLPIQLRGLYVLHWSMSQGTQAPAQKDTQRGMNPHVSCIAATQRGKLGPQQ